MQELKTANETANTRVFCLKCKFMTCMTFNWFLNPRTELRIDMVLTETGKLPWRHCTILGEGFLRDRDREFCSVEQNLENHLLSSFNFLWIKMSKKKKKKIDFSKKNRRTGKKIGAREQPTAYGMQTGIWDEITKFSYFHLMSYTLKNCKKCLVNYAPTLQIG